MIGAFRETAKRLLYSPPLRAVGGRVRPRAVVLLYHRVARVAEAGADPHGLAVPPATFEAHLELLQRRFHLAPLPELVGGLPRRAHRDGTVAVTFDDGYADNLAVALPIALRRSVPLTVFVAAGPVLEGGPFPWDRDNPQAGRPLTAYELRRLAAAPGVSIGGHTVTHPRLSDLPPARQTWELTAGRERLEAITGRPVDLLAYPFGKPGDVAPTTPRLAERAGYRAAFLSQAGRIVPSSPRYALPRLSVHDWTAPELLRRVEEILG